ncbi:MAG: fibrobacter succinogenes major paralogous domain-containing protein [Bacteroidales bacterium]|nr:fibrobacter succinogenes major paralogous domain-containing protein [Bacteroidales bacterium]
MKRTSLILSIVTLILFSIILINSSCKKDEKENSTSSFTYKGQTYNTVLIGSQVWMKENLNYATGNSWCYDEDPANCASYGRLYDWATIMNGEASSNSVPSGVQGICPPGWHVPSDEEWKILEGTVDSQYGVGDPEWNDTVLRGFDVGKRLKSVLGWPENTGTDAYGFSALPGGDRNGFGNFYSIGRYADFWSSTEHNYYYAWARSLYYNNDEASRYDNYKAYGFSLRCVKD